MEETHRSNLQTLDAALQSKLRTVEATFQVCDAALKRLQQDQSAASSAVQGAEPPATAILRKRLDDLAADLLMVHAEAQNADAKAQDAGDQVVSTNVSLQNGVHGPAAPSHRPAQRGCA